MKEEIITDIQRKKAILMGLFIARFSKKALESFGFTTYKEAYNVFGYSVNIPPSSIKLYQQEFDLLLPQRQGRQETPRQRILQGSDGRVQGLEV